MNRIVRSRKWGCPPQAYIAPWPRRQFGRLLAGSLLAASLWAGLPATAQTTVGVQGGVSYGPSPAEVGDFYLPASPREGRAAVVMIHGGGWVTGGREYYDWLGRTAAGAGLVVFSIDYRLARAEDPSTHWPAQLQDAQLAVRFLRAHAGEWGVDPARVGALGDSAGAQLAMFLGVLPHPLPGDRASLYPAVSPQVAAVVDQFGPMDLAALGPGAAGTFDALFGTANPDAAQAQSTSPLPEVSATSAPTYIIHGHDDHLVPFHDSERLLAALQARGVAAKLVAYAGDHSYWGVPPEQAGSIQQAAVAWLQQQLQK